MNNRQIESLITLMEEYSGWNNSSFDHFDLFFNQQVVHITSFGDGLLGSVRTIEKTFGKYESEETFYRNDGLIMYYNYHDSFFNHKVSLKYLYERDIITQYIKTINNNILYVNDFLYDEEKNPIKKNVKIYSLLDGSEMIGHIENTIRTKEIKNSHTFAFNYLSDKSLKQIKNVVIVDSIGTIRDYSFHSIIEATYDQNSQLLSWYDSSDMSFIDFADKIRYERDIKYEYGFSYQYNFDTMGNWLTKRSEKDNNLVHRKITYY